MFDLSAMMIGVDGFVVFLVVADQGVEVGRGATGGIDLVVIHQADEGELDGAACKGVHKRHHMALPEGAGVMWIVVSAGGSIGSSGPSGTVSVTRGMVSDGGSSAGGIGPMDSLWQEMSRSTKHTIRNLVM